MPSAWTLLLVAAAAAQPLSFTIDASAPITSAPLNLPLLDCVGVGHAALMLRADLQEHLRNVQRDIGFARIRGHGILNDDMSVWLGGSVNMYNVFRVLDVLLALTPPMHPILELSFMPDDLAYDKSHTIMHYKGGTSAPRDFAQWERFIGDFVQLIVDRYGIATVQQFRFEAWNEPAYCGFYCPPPNVTNLDSYLALYNATSRAVLGVDATLSVGGPATAELGWVDEFIASGLPARFLSSHSYPTDARGSPYTRTSFEEALYEVANKSAAAGLPFVMTEASAGWEGNAYDAPFAGAWIVHMAAAFLGVANVPTISYWTLSDIFEEQGMESTPYAEVFGIQTKYGIAKPAYRALQLLRQLPRTGLAARVGSGSAPEPPRHPARACPAAAATATSRTVDLIAAIDASAGTTIALHALLTNFNANIADQENATSGLPIDAEAGVSVTFEGIPAGAVVARAASVQLLDAEHGWAKPAWLAAGSPRYPTPAQLAAEAAASQFGLLQAPAVASAPGAVTVTLPPLLPYACAYIVLQYEVPSGVV